MNARVKERCLAMLRGRRRVPEIPRSIKRQLRVLAVLETGFRWGAGAMILWVIVWVIFWGR